MVCGKDNKYTNAKLYIMHVTDKKLFFRILFITGFIMIIVSAMDYLAGWDKISPTVGTIGIIFVANGIVFGHVKK
jgi:hypothetical protein